MAVRAHLLIRGRVQGVWYRGSMENEAERLGVAGWVRNRPDGSVEAEVEGAPEAVDARYEEDYGQLRSRHILITFDTAATDKALDESNALAKATAIRDQLRQDPNNQDLWNQLARTIRRTRGARTPAASSDGSARVSS